MEQLNFLDGFLAESNNKINAVVYIDVPEDVLVERLHGRFACKKCGENYHKITKPTKVEGVCDVCGSHEFSVRDDDKDINAIHSRFKIFAESTKPVLDTYAERGIVIKVDGNKKPDEIAKDIMAELNKIKNK
jgi:adenylate kinase